MDKSIKNNNTIFFNSLSYNNKIGLNYENFIKTKINNNTNINKINNNDKNRIIPKINMNPLYINLMRYNSITNNNNIKFINSNNNINSLLIDFNKQLEKEYNLNKLENINENNYINKNNYDSLIKKLESQDDERFKKSRFLKFIKDINSHKIIINEEKNIIEKNINFKENTIDDNINELEELLNKAKTYMNYNREDLAKNILEQIFDNSKLKLKENKKYLKEAYLFLILCYFNENEDLLSISFIIDLLYLIDEENNENNYEYLYDKKYLTKEFIQEINKRDFDITNKEQYNNYINNKQKIHEEIENYLKNKINSNKNEDNNQILLLLYGLILYLNEKYNNAEKIFNQLIILDNKNYFYFNILGVIYSNQKKFEDSIKCYKKALEINSQYPKCLINLSLLYLNKGEYKESCKYLINSLKIFDDIPDAWNYLLSNIIELNEEDLIYDLNNKNLKNIENRLI